ESRECFSAVGGATHTPTYRIRPLTSDEVVMLRCAIVDFGQAASPTARSPATGSCSNSSSLSAPSVVTPTMARLALSHGVARDDLPVECRAQLGRATLRRVVHIMEAELVPGAVGPLEVVHQ